MFWDFLDCLEEYGDSSCLTCLIDCTLQQAQTYVCHHVHSYMHVPVHRYEISVQTRTIIIPT